MLVTECIGDDVRAVYDNIIWLQHLLWISLKYGMACRVISVESTPANAISYLFLQTAIVLLRTHT